MKPAAMDVSVLSGVHDHCVTQARQRIPFFRDLTDHHIKNLVEQAVRCAAALDLVFENPRNESQRLAYAQFHGRDLWVVLGPNAIHRHGDWLAVTILVSKSPQKEMLAYAHERLGIERVTEYSPGPQDQPCHVTL